MFQFSDTKTPVHSKHEQIVRQKTVCYDQIFLCVQISGCIGDQSSARRVNSFPMTDVSPRNSVKDNRKIDAPVSLNQFYSMFIVFGYPFHTLRVIMTASVFNSRRRIVIFVN